MTQLEAPPLRGSSRKNHKNSKPHPASKTCENHQGCTGWGKMPTSSDILLNWSISGLPRCCRERGPCHKKWNLHRSMSALPPIVCLFIFCLFVFCSKYVVFTHELTAQFGNLVSYVHLSDNSCFLSVRPSLLLNDSITDWSPTSCHRAYSIKGSQFHQSISSILDIFVSKIYISQTLSASWLSQSKLKN